MATYEGEVKEGTYIMKDAEGNEVRLVKEEDLLALKDSRNEFEKQAKETQAQIEAARKEADTRVEAQRQEVLKAQAEVDNLKSKVSTGQASLAELDKAKADLEAAKSSGEQAQKQVLDLRRQLIAKTYGVPLATVESKDADQLTAFEDALKAVIGNSPGGFALGSGGGGASNDNLSPMERARKAYETSGKK
jgi:membrane protein involved in colicin uptake